MFVENNSPAAASLMDWRSAIRAAARSLFRLAGPERHLLFFLGAGVSQPSCFPLSRDINEYVFSDELEWVRGDAGSSGTFRKSSGKVRSGGKNSAQIKTLRAFLKILRDKLQAHFDKQASESENPHDRTTNYEDLYFLCEQIARSEKGSDRDISAGLLAAHIKMDASAHLLRDPDAKRPERSDLAYTADQSIRLIRSVLQSHLDRKPKKIKGLGLLLEAARSDDYDRITIVTLNHDLLVELLFEREGIAFEDGFGQPVGPKKEVQPYEPDLLFNPKTKVRIIKPHGAVNWYSAWFRDKAESNQKGPNLDYVKLAGPPSNPQGRRTAGQFEIPGSLPALLSSQSKESSYGEDIFSDMMTAFLMALHDAEVVVVSGFGWNDPGMRERLIAALERRRSKCMVLLHNGTDLWNRRGGLNIFRMQPLMEQGQFRQLHQWLCDTTWTGLQREIAGLEKSDPSGTNLP